MTEQYDSHDITRILVTTAALVVIIGGIHLAHTVLTTFLVAVFLAVIGMPQVRWLERKGIPGAAAVLLTVACMAAVLLVTGVLVGTSLKSFSDNIPAYQKILREHVDALRALLETRGISTASPFMSEQVDPGAVMSFTARALTTAGSALVEIVMILLTVTFILFEASSFHTKVSRIFGVHEKDFVCFSRFTRDIHRYMVIKTGISLAAAVLVGIWLTVLGVDYPVLWAVLAFLLHYVPNIGSLIAAVPPVLLALIQFGTGRAVLTVAGYTAINFILGNAVEPKVMGRKLGLSTLAVFLSLIFWGGLLGLIGVVLAVPFTMTLKFACEHNKSTRWIAILLGPETPSEQAFQATKKETVPAPEPG